MRSACATVFKPAQYYHANVMATYRKAPLHGPPYPEATTTTAQPQVLRRGLPHTNTQPTLFSGKPEYTVGWGDFEK